MSLQTGCLRKVMYEGNCWRVTATHNAFGAHPFRSSKLMSSPMRVHYADAFADLSILKNAWYPLGTVHSASDDNNGE